MYVKLLVLLSAATLVAPLGVRPLNHGSMMNPFHGTNFWNQFEHGFRQLEHAAKESAESLEGKLKSWLTSREDTLTDDDDHEDVDDDEPESSAPGFSMNPMSDIFGLFGGSRQQWWKGPNVCITRDEIDENQQKNETDTEVGSIFGSFHFSSCQQTPTKYTCTTKVRNHGIRKTFVVTYECCYGHRRVQGQPGCTEMKMKPLMETVTDLGATDFVELVKTSRLEEKMSSSNITLFAPSDEAVRDFTDALEEANQVEFYVPPGRARRSIIDEGTTMKEVILGHMVPGFEDLNEISNEQVLYSDNMNSSIRMNVYPGPGERVVTANCARVTSMNNYATNGIVHMINHIMRPVTHTIGELVSKDTQFTTLKQLISKADLLKTLKDEEGHFTLFAPTDAAFDKLDQSLKTRLLQGEGCVANVLRHHILPHTVCSAAIAARVRAVNLVGEILPLERRDDDKLFVDDAQLVIKDVVGTNGIIHVIDSVLIPESARTMTTALSDRNLSQFLKLLQEAGLQDSLDSMSNLTLFAPTNDAIDSLSTDELKELKGNPTKLRELLMYHMAGPESQGCDMENNQLLKTGLMDKSVRVNLFATIPFFTGSVTKATAQCARIMHFDNRVCGGVIHEVDKVLLPPEGEILEIIKSDDKFSVLKRLIEDTGIEKELQESGPFTLLAPTDDAFYKLEEKELDELLRNKEKAVEVLRQHILPEILCCSGVGVTAWPFTNRVESLAGNTHGVRRDHDGRVHIGNARVHKCDIMATNGVIHTVNRVMLPERRQHHQAGLFNGAFQRFGNPNVEVFLFGA